MNREMTTNLHLNLKTPGQPIFKGYLNIFSKMYTIYRSAETKDKEEDESVEKKDSYKDLQEALLKAKRMNTSKSIGSFANLGELLGMKIE